MDKPVSKEGAVNSISSKNCYSRWCTYVNKDWRSKVLPSLKIKSDRQHAFASYYGHDYNIRHNAGIEYKIQPEVMLCIAWADSHLWKALKTKNNFGNVGNNDRWDVIHYETPQQWIRAIARVLNNKYLWNKKTIWDLSFAWDCKIDCTKAYATSKENRQNNVLNCMSLLRNVKTTPDYNFRK